MKLCTAILSAVLLVAAVGCRSDGGGTAPADEQPLPVRVVDVPARTLITLPRTGPYAEMDATIETFLSYLENHGIQPQGELMAVFYDDPSAVAPEKTRYEIRMPVRAGTTAEAPYRVIQAPRMKAAAVTLVGTYEKIAEQYPRLYAWVPQHGYRCVGPLNEVYLVHPGSGVPPEQYVTEVLIPVEPMTR